MGFDSPSGYTQKTQNDTMTDVPLGDGPRSTREKKRNNKNKNKTT